MAVSKAISYDLSCVASLAALNFVHIELHRPSSHALCFTASEPSPHFDEWTSKVCHANGTCLAMGHPSHGGPAFAVMRATDAELENHSPSLG